MTVSEDFLRSANRQFLYYKTLGEKAIEQLEPKQLFISVNEDTNSIAAIIKHLHGNMSSRWTDFLTTDGEKEWRNRDGEFEENININFSASRHPELDSGSQEMLNQVQHDKQQIETKKQELLKTWNEGWDCLFKVLNDLKPEQLAQTIYIRNEGHSVLEAINRQLAHYPYHVGQIVFYAKLLKKTEWNSLSIPKNKSKDYNTDKFSKDKVKKHFTDDELDKLK
ncbi:MAG: DUF1572 family protein [Burkholderiales bacterium]|nr:DUF1572 family protein [Bacteroidia bacterium]